MRDDRRETAPRRTRLARERRDDDVAIERDLALHERTRVRPPTRS